MQFLETKQQPTIDNVSLGTTEQAMRFIGDHSERVVIFCGNAIHVTFNSEKAEHIFTQWRQSNDQGIEEILGKVATELERIKADGWEFIAHQTSTEQVIRGSDLLALYLGHLPTGATLNNKAMRQTALDEIKEFIEKH